MLSIEVSESSGTIQHPTRIFTALRVYLGKYSLTERETEIVLLVLRGMSNKEIARSCSITEQTVKDHLKHAYGKVGVHQRSALYATVLRNIFETPFL